MYALTYDFEALRTRYDTFIKIWNSHKNPIESPYDTSRLVLQIKIKFFKGKIMYYENWVVRMNWCWFLSRKMCAQLVMPLKPGDLCTLDAVHET